MEGDLDVPIALRRTRRSLGHSTQQPSPSPSSRASSPRPTQETVNVHTPKSRKRRVRFSDPGPDLTGSGDKEPSTGLTPMIRRASLTGTRTPRRRSTPARLLPSNGSGIPDMDSQGSPFGGEVHFLPLRQVLDGRVKRRIRRNGLSEEMNTISAERRRRTEETKAEIERLKAELADKDAEIERMHDETMVLDTGRVWDLEQQVAALKKELASHSGVQHVPSSPAYNWTRSFRDPYPDAFMEMDMEDDTEEFGDSTRAELMCSTPTRRMAASFPTPPATSPEPQLPQTPCRLPDRRPETPRLSVGIQASLQDLKKRQLEEELESLQLEVNRLKDALESYSALTSRLSEKLAPLTSDPPTDEPSESNSDLETHLTTILQQLSDRTATLAELDSSLKTLGFPGLDAFEVIDSLRSGFRSARLELEYLTPGEVTLPLTGAGGEVLDLVLAQLRTLAQKSRDADDAIDEYHEIELSLRQQLNARVTAMDGLAQRLTQAEHAARAKDQRIADLEVGLDRLKNAARTYTRDIAELEALVERMEADVAASDAKLTEAKAEQDKVVADKTVAVLALEEKLAAATQHLQSELDNLTKTHDTAFAERDARIAELEGEIERVGAALRGAQETLQKLRTENAGLAEANEVLDEQRKTAEEVVAKMRRGLEGVMRMGEGFFSGERTVVVGGSDVDGEGSEVFTPAKKEKAGRLMADEDVARSGRGVKRRKYDSGLGFLDEEEVGGEA